MVFAKRVFMIVRFSCCHRAQGEYDVIFFRGKGLILQGITDYEYLEKMTGAFLMWKVVFGERC